MAMKSYMFPILFFVAACSSTSQLSAEDIIEQTPEVGIPQDTTFESDPTSFEITEGNDLETPEEILIEAAENNDNIPDIPVPTTVAPLELPDNIIRPVNVIVGYNSIFTYEELQTIDFVEGEGEPLWYVGLGKGLLGSGWQLSVTDGNNVIEGNPIISNISTFTFQKPIDFEEYNTVLIITPEGNNLEANINVERLE